MWAKPAQLTGPSPTYKMVGRSQPNKFWGGPNPAHKFGLGQIRSDPYSRLMILPLHAEDTWAGTGQK